MHAILPARCVRGDGAGRTPTTADVGVRDSPRATADDGDRRSVAAGARLRTSSRRSAPPRPVHVTVDRGCSAQVGAVPTDGGTSICGARTRRDLLERPLSLSEISARIAQIQSLVAPPPRAVTTSPCDAGTAPEVGEDAVMAPDSDAGPHAAHEPRPVGQVPADPAAQAEWDRRYAEQDQLWSGQPNGALVAEVAGLTPGRVLDVGCGEGADAVWLARQGWDVTALDVSGVALDRAAGHARDAGVTVQWIHAGLAEADLSPHGFDLVTAQYHVLPRTPDAAAERALLGAVAPGGVLLLVHHAGMDTREVHNGFDPADYVWPAMIAAMLDDAWQVEINEQRPRVAPDGGAGTHHVDDIVLKARRLR
jgi:SAM-dependent methyltransferase